MSDRLSPAELFALPPSSPRLTERPWTVDHSSGPLAEKDLSGLLPARTRFTTSGSTGDPVPWYRTGEQLAAEAALLAGLLSDAAPEAVVTFAPPRHLYGMLTGVLVPALLGVPVWYVPKFAPLPPASGRRWAVAAIPWTFPILARRRAWLDTAGHVAFLHSTSVLPRTAADLLADLGERASLTEIFGSTETGGVAFRRWAPGDPPWRLFPDVEFARAGGDTREEALLGIRSPRLASPGEGGPAREWTMDDHVVRSGARGFCFAGRRTRLVNVNGRRLDLDHLEERLRGVVPCDDLACVPVADPMTGEHFELLIAPGPAGTPDPETLAAAAAAVDPRPRAVRVVERIDRSETGKLRRVQTAHARSEGADA